MRALISVYDKRGLDEFARGLAELGVELVASGGTAAYLLERGLRVERVEDLTDVPELLGGRVKTLHPRVHAGILARRDRPDDVAALDQLAIAPFDLVCVNLYPFEEAAWRAASEEDAIELIDIGGPALLRAAAKNFAHVAPIARPEQYDAVLAELRAGRDLSHETRRALAAEAFATTAAYEAAIATWFSPEAPFPETVVLPLRKELDLSYGENPHQRAAYYAQIGARRHLLSRTDQLHGRPLSFNNLNDLSGAISLLCELEGAACVIVKHANPCGVAVSGSFEEAWDGALACDPVSAYGGVVAVNRPVDLDLATRLAEQFVEVLWAPAVADDALEILSRKPSPRILVDRDRRAFDRRELDVKRVPGGALLQERDRVSEGRSDMHLLCGTLTDEQWDDLLFAWRVCSHVASNAIVVARGRRTIGIGGGQTSRVDAVRIAVDKARAHGHELRGAVLASDAFFPFADGPQVALEAGVTAIIQPGGSKRDPEVVEAVERTGAAMVVTRRRHFRH